MSIGIPKSFAFGTPNGYEAKLKIGGADIATREDLTIVGCVIGTKQARRTTSAQRKQNGWLSRR
ncbi:hypothetical protein DIPPA_29973 [Diplonema papillatum]|nr:hypothetical protein DIPPA_29973 [Diplonema papillatum]